MFVTIIFFLITLTSIYLAAGFFFSIAFIIKGVMVVDEGAEGCTIGFRIIIIPATIILWPLLLMKWITAVKNKQHD